MARGLRPTRDMVLTDFTEAGALPGRAARSPRCRARSGPHAMCGSTAAGQVGDATGFSGFADILAAGWITDAENFGGKSFGQNAGLME
jgi:hypothetical protein